MALPLAALALGSVLLAGGAAAALVPAPPPQPAPSHHPARTSLAEPRPDPVALAAPDAGPVTSSAPGPVATPNARWGAPLLGPLRVVRGFDPPPSPWLPGHRGVDLAALPGDTVLAAGAGTVTYAGPLAGRGVVTVTHGALRTTYEPVSATVSVGERVVLGERIGVLGTGSSHCGGIPPCLHWGLLRGTTYLDPLLLLGLSHPVLLPVPNR